MPSNTTYNPQNVSEFEKSKLIKNAQGVSGTATAGTTTNFDLTLSDDCLMVGGFLLASGASAGDTVTFQVLMGSTVLAEFVSNWYMNPDSTKQDTPNANFPAKVNAGLTLRVIYNSIGSTDVWIAINYDLQKVLV